MSLLDMFNEQQQQKTASASNQEQELVKQAQDFYELGSNLAIRQLKVAAEEATGMKDEGGNGGNGMSEEDYKAKRKKELIEQMQSSPEKKEEIKKEVSGS